jgi:hypothetical protein
MQLANPFSRILSFITTRDEGESSNEWVELHRLQHVVQLCTQSTHIHVVIVTLPFENNAQVV